MFVQLIDNPWMILAIPPAIIILVMILQKPVIGIYLASFLIPLEDVTTLFTNVTLLKILLAFTFLAWLLRELVSKNRIRFQQMSFIVLLAIWSVMSLVWSYSLNDSLERISTFIQVILFSIMAFNLLKTKSDIERVMIIYIFASVLTAIIAINLLSSGVLLRNRAAFIEGQNPNGFSRSLGMSLLFILYFLQTDRFKHKFLLYPFGVMFLLVIVLAQSRGTYIALIVSLPIIIYYSKFGNNLRFIIMGTIAALLTFYLFPNILLEYVFPRALAGFTEFSLGGRNVIWLVGWEMIKDHPFFGVGFGNFTSIYGQYSLPLRGWYAETDPHNVFVAFQAELGIVGTVIFSLFLYRIYKKIKSIDSKHLIDKAWSLSFLLYIVVGAMSNSLHYTKFFWLEVALVVAFINQSEFIQIDGHQEGKVINKTKPKLFYTS